MNRYFMEPELEVIQISVEDVITTSCADDCADDDFIPVAGLGNCFG